MKLQGLLVGASMGMMALTGCTQYHDATSANITTTPVSDTVVYETEIAAESLTDAEVVHVFKNPEPTKRTFFGGETRPEVIVGPQSTAVYEASEQYNELLDSYRISYKPEGAKRYFFNKYGVVAEQTAPTPAEYEEVDMDVIAKASVDSIYYYEKQRAEIARQQELKQAQEAKARAEYAKINGLRMP